jgi:hypothetical protein
MPNTIPPLKREKRRRGEEREREGERERDQKLV